MKTRWLVFVCTLLIAVSLGAPASIHAQTEAPTPPAQTDSPGDTHTLTIPAAAFQPAHDDYDFQIHGRYLIHFGQAGQNFAGAYFAPLNLPQGARITKITYYWKDPGVGDTAAVIERALRWTDINQPVAGVPGSYDVWTPSFGNTSSTFNHFNVDEPINNFAYSYHVRIDISGGGQVWGCAFQIEYIDAGGATTSGLVTVPQAAFTPFSDGHNYYLGGWYRDTFGGPSSLFGRSWYFAPVYLPDGATVTGLSFQWKRLINTGQTSTTILYRTLLSNDNYDFMASAGSSAGSGPFNGATFTTAISGAQVLNQLFSYWLILDTPANNPPEVQPREVFVQYSLSTPYNYVLSIPSAAFQPYENGYDFENHGRHIEHIHGPGNSTTNGWYLAPVNLPDGATIQRMDFHWVEKSGVAGVARLQRTTLNAGDYQELATIFTSTGSGALTGGVGSDTSVSGGPVDNQRYAYWVVVDIPASANAANRVLASTVRLNYSVPIYLPMVWK